MTVTFDPNPRPTLWNSEEQMIEATNRIAAKCDVFMPGLSEGQLFSGLTDPRAIADYYLDMGVRQVVIKLGAEGSALFERDESGAAARPWCQALKSMWWTRSARATASPPA